LIGLTELTTDALTKNNSVIETINGMKKEIYTISLSICVALIPCLFTAKYTAVVQVESVAFHAVDESPAAFPIGLYVEQEPSSYG
jgi:hypothetical protein